MVFILSSMLNRLSIIVLYIYTGSHEAFYFSNCNNNKHYAPGEWILMRIVSRLNHE
jgi:hypothetical protein